ncbi:hypothetical protein AWC19_22275 [Mycobacterium palustre]|uniref:Uncharacterized protein n=2 Tax=Mycobacterium palustre TaxID=153971 RepID=A0A1X1YYZ1_9MYCO|nr:hypothetical protein AWC19_22275 [Mycobacterium palustre]
MFETRAPEPGSPGETPERLTPEEPPERQPHGREEEDMRAEEGDETVNEYAAKGKQTLGKIKDTQRQGSPLGRIVRRITRLFRSE